MIPTRFLLAALFTLSICLIKISDIFNDTQPNGKKEVVYAFLIAGATFFWFLSLTMRYEVVCIYLAILFALIVTSSFIISYEMRKIGQNNDTIIGQTGTVAQIDDDVLPTGEFFYMGTMDGSDEKIEFVSTEKMEKGDKFIVTDFGENFIIAEKN